MSRLRKRAFCLILRLRCTWAFSSYLAILAIGSPPNWCISAVLQLTEELLNSSLFDVPSITSKHTLLVTGVVCKWWNRIALHVYFQEHLLPMKIFLPQNAFSAWQSFFPKKRVMLLHSKPPLLRAPIYILFGAIIHWKNYWGYFIPHAVFWILNGNIFIIKNDSFEWISTITNGGLQKAPILCNLKASRICIELQNYWRSVEMRTDTLKKESHIAFRHPISSSTPHSETERSGKL